MPAGPVVPLGTVIRKRWSYPGGTAGADLALDWYANVQAYGSLFP